MEIRELHIYSPSEQGGVRNVTEGLAEGAVNAGGYRVVVSRTMKEMLLAALRSSVARKNRHAIFSLGSGALAPLYGRSVYILHGFPVKPMYGVVRTLVLRCIPLFASHFGAVSVAVSHLTKNVFSRIYGQHVDQVIHNGVTRDFLYEYQPLSREEVVLYVGRLSSNKGIQAIVAAFKDSGLNSVGKRLLIAGRGELEDFVRGAALSIPGVEYLGEVSEEDKINLMRRSRCFVSLNDFEPMGVVYAEAVCSGCILIGPMVFGASEAIDFGYPVFRCDPNDVSSIANAMGEAFSYRDEIIVSQQVRERFSYDKIAKRYISVIEGGIND